jgi:hypothetical protein
MDGIVAMAIANVTLAAGCFLEYCFGSIDGLAFPIDAKAFQMTASSHKLFFRLNLAS